MGIQITLTDAQFPVSPVLIDFLHNYLNNGTFDSSWHDQQSENLTNRSIETLRSAEAAVNKIVQNPEALKVINRSYELMISIMTGTLDRLLPFQKRFHFICVTGIPRSGGSYLTKQLYDALGMNGDTIPTAIAHDGFPDSEPFDLKDRFNSYTRMTRFMAEYLAMLELFFSGKPPHRDDNSFIVPKKLHKAAYYGAFYNSVFGPTTEYIITLRHPVSACISTYEKSGGLPDNGKFAVRSNIEDSIQRDILHMGGKQEELPGMDYFDAYLRYWENYHYNLVLSGLRKHSNWDIVVFSPERMVELAQSFYARFNNPGKAEVFHAHRKCNQHKDWATRAENSIRRVADIWQTAGINYPVDEVMVGW